MIKEKKASKNFETSDYLEIVKLFIFWRLLLFVMLGLGIVLVSANSNFLGGGAANYISNPWAYAWANFDGEHFISIAMRGYLPLQYFFFPAYPYITGLLANVFGGDIKTYLFSGLFVSHISLLVALLGLWKLILLDYKKNIARLTILTILLFPTSFYLASFYSESLFLALIVWTFYFARQKKWLLAGLLAGIASATRVIGVILPLVIVVEWWQANDRKLFPMPFKALVGVLLAGSGLAIYMLFLKETTGDYLEFINRVGLFGEQRSSGLILLPQVIYRYVFKILPSVDYSYLPMVFTIWLEFPSSVLFLILSVVSFFRLRLSYSVYLTLGYLIPTLAGSFSSMPRYAIVLFPGFILMAIYFSKLSRIRKLILLLVLFILLGTSTIMFTRGYWVS